MSVRSEPPSDCEQRRPPSRAPHACRAVTRAPAQATARWSSFRCTSGELCASAGVSTQRAPRRCAHLADGGFASSKASLTRVSRGTASSASSAGSTAAARVDMLGEVHTVRAARTTQQCELPLQTTRNPRAPRAGFPRVHKLYDSPAGPDGNSMTINQVLSPSYCSAVCTASAGKLCRTAHVSEGAVRGTACALRAGPHPLALPACKPRPTPSFHTPSCHHHHQPHPQQSGRVVEGTEHRRTQGRRRERRLTPSTRPTRQTRLVRM